MSWSWGWEAVSSIFNPTPRNQRGAEGCLNRHPHYRRLENSGLTALLMGRTADFYIVSSWIRSSNLSVTGPTLLPARLPAAPKGEQSKAERLWKWCFPLDQYRLVLHGTTVISRYQNIMILMIPPSSNTVVPFHMILPHFSALQIERNRWRLLENVDILSLVYTFSWIETTATSLLYAWVHFTIYFTSMPTSHVASVISQPHPLPAHSHSFSLSTLHVHLFLPSV